METKDDRTPEQKTTHTVLVLATDSFMSGWGGAVGGASYAAWACQPDDVNRVERWVRNRSEMKRVRIVAADGYRPGRGCAHFHIYVADEGHPSLS